jgi:hypothetical protein
MACEVTVAPAQRCRTIGDMTRRAHAFVAALLLALLAGCATEPESTPTSTNSSPVESGNEESTSTIDCTTAETISVRLLDGGTFANVEEATIPVDGVVRLVVETDTAVEVRAGGSNIDEQQLDTGVSSLCMGYPVPGRYAVAIGETVPAHVVVVAGATGEAQPEATR